LSHVAFIKKLVAAGGEMLATSPGNEWEVLRFRTKFGVGVVYRNKRGGETWNREAQAAKDHVLTPGSGSLAAVKVGKRRNIPHEYQTLLERDGQECFFCLGALGEDMTREHLVAVAHGGPNHLSNKFLAHQRCNNDAGHLSAPEKIRIREAAMRRRWECEILKEIA
jgi:hypothetical protein